MAILFGYKNFERLILNSDYDYLTKIYNRNKFDELLSREFNRSKRYNYTFSILMFDIDFFKKINDQYGHNVGDEVLKKLASVIQDHIRVNDSLARWGGEEFVCILPFINLKEALKVAEKLRRLIEETVFIKGEIITVSIGVSEMNKELHQVNDLIENTDKAMYRAKEGGRNRVCQ